ncbi:hypothetical protein [Pseudomonas protegens]|nr:hypothetical protein [Pseudomonas protegens]
MNTAALADYRSYPLISALATVQVLPDRLQVHWAGPAGPGQWPVR